MRPTPTLHPIPLRRPASLQHPKSYLSRVLVSTGGVTFLDTLFLLVIVALLGVATLSLAVRAYDHDLDQITKPIEVGKPSLDGLGHLRSAEPTTTNLDGSVRSIRELALRRPASRPLARKERPQ